MIRTNRGITGVALALAALLIVGCGEMMLLEEVRSRVPSVNGDDTEPEEEDLGIAQLNLPSGVDTEFYANRLGLQYGGELDVGSFLTSAWIVNDAFPLEAMFFDDEEPPQTVDSFMALVIEFEDASNSVGIDAGSYAIGQTGIGGVYQVILFVDGSVNAEGDPSGAEYCAMVDTTEFDNPPMSIDPISGGTIDVAINGDEYTFTLDVTLESGEEITGTVTAAPDLIDDTTTFTLELDDADGFDGSSLLYGVFEEGAVVEPGDPDNLALAGGEAVISGGWAEALAETSDGATWQGKIGQNYDIYPMIDTNGNGEWDDWYDFGYDSMPLIIRLDDPWGEYENVGVSSFSGPGPHPMPSGIYSESTAIYVEPVWGEENLTADRESSAVTAFEGSYHLDVNFTQPDPSWLHWNYPDSPAIVDMSNASSLVLYHVPLDASEYSVEVLMWSPGSGFSGPTLVNGGNYLTDQGVGPGGIWDRYEIPISVLTSGGDPPVDITRVTGIKIGNPHDASGSRVGPNLYFDDIHFE